MDTKPFSLQAPEAIAKEYGGNKQKIGQAAQMGLVDPTAAVLAGMFIDRMRTAQQQEMQPQQTVAQQVFAPPAPVGLGAMQPQGAPAMPQAPQAPMAPPMPPQQGMAEGGLAGLEIPDDMFMETDDYADGGIVAFAGSGLATAAPKSGYVVPDIAGAYKDIESLVGPYGGPALAEYEKYLAEERGPEAKERGKKQDLGEFLARLGFGMAAGQSPNFLQNLAAAAAPAGEAAITAGKERKKEQRELLKDQVNTELSKYNIKVQNATTAANVANTIAQLQDAGYTRDNAVKVAAMQIQGNKDVENIRSKSYENYAGRQETLLRKQALLEAPKIALERAKLDGKYRDALMANDTTTAKQILEQYRKEAFAEMTGESLTGSPPAAPGAFSEGQTSKDVKGRTIVFRGGQWVYP